MELDNFLKITIYLFFLTLTLVLNVFSNGIMISLADGTYKILLIKNSNFL